MKWIKGTHLKKGMVLTDGVEVAELKFSSWYKDVVWGVVLDDGTTRSPDLMYPVQSHWKKAQNLSKGDLVHGKKVASVGNPRYPNDVVVRFRGGERKVFKATEQVEVTF